MGVNRVRFSEEGSISQGSQQPALKKFPDFSMPLSPDFTGHLYKNAERSEAEQNPAKHLV